MYQKYSYYRCAYCGLVSTYPYPTTKTLYSHYSKRFYDGNYNLLHTFSSEYKHIYADFVTFLKKTLLNNTDIKLNKAKILDIGCFTGDFLKLLTKHGADVYGIELQDEAVKIANQRLPNRILRADIEKDTVPKRYYDVITILGVIEHVIDPKKLLQYCSRSMKKGSVLMIQTPNSSSLLASIMKKYWPPYSPVEHIHLFSKKSLEIALQTEGFECITYVPHWKHLPIAYVFNMLKNFGPKFHILFYPFYRILPSPIKRLTLPFYIGEMIVIAKRV